MSKGFFPDENDGKRYSTKSLISAINKRDKKRWGPFRDRCEQWSSHDDNYLLYVFLDVGLPIIGDKSLVANLKRTRDAVKTRLRKISYKYPDVKYVLDPEIRHDRTGMKLVPRERYLMGLAFGAAGRKYGAVAGGYDYIAKVLNRSVDNTTKIIYGIMEEEIYRISKSTGFNVEHKKIPTDPERINQIVARALVKEVQRFNEWFGKSE